MIKPRTLSKDQRRASAERRARRRLIPDAKGFITGLDPAMQPSAPAHINGLAVVTCHYNFAGYNAPVRNLLRFCREMDSAGIPVYGMEIYQEGARAIMEESPRWKCVSVNHQRYALWQKEAALNAVVASLPETVTHVALVDADVRFERTQWVEDSITALSAFPAVQPFSEAVWTDERGAGEFRRLSVASVPQIPTWRAHPGFAWVIKRGFWLNGPGLYPWCITGAGDVALTHGLMTRPIDKPIKRAVGDLNMVTFERWCARARAWSGGVNVSAVAGRIWHEWHGSRVNRAYETRHDALASVDVRRHVGIDGNGLLYWNDGAPEPARDSIRGLFISRREDG